MRTSTSPPAWRHCARNGSVSAAIPKCWPRCLPSSVAPARPIPGSTPCAFGQRPHAAPRPRRRQRVADALREEGHRHARDGIHRDPREPAHRGDPRSAPAEAASGRALRRQHPEADHARVRARRSRARPRHHPQQHQPPGKRADDHRPQFPDQGQREHRQLRGVVGHRRGSGETGVGDPLGCGHGDGPVHRQTHPRNPRVDHPQLAGADRHRADLSGAGKGRRQGRRTHLGNLPRHADRTGRAGRGLLHHPRRRAAALRAAHRQARHRHRRRAAVRSWRNGAWRTTRKISSTPTSRTSARS